MGKYNPHAPYIIGEEWVPIRQANFKPDSITEHGYTFSIDHAVTAVSGAFYVSDLPAKIIQNTTEIISLYRAGNENLSGPIHMVTIPVESIALTGAVTGTFDRLLNPTDFLAVQFQPTALPSFLGINFAVPTYTQQLVGKRILRVQLVYALSGAIEDLVTGQISIEPQIQTGSNVGLTYQTYWEGSTDQALSGEYSYVDFGSINPQPSTSLNHGVQSINYPWRIEELLQLSSSATTGINRRQVILSQQTGMFDFAYVHYVGLQVFYCEENRIGYGARRAIVSLVSSGALGTFELGANLVMLRDTAQNAGVALTPGAYTVTLRHEPLGPTFTAREAPTVNGLRELYPLPTQPGKIINLSWTPDDEFTVDDTDVITELTLHTASAVITGVHPYGVQDDIPVYGTITAIQEIEDDPVGSAKSFPQVRFYARRFGNTSAALTLVDVATGLSTVSISVEDFDALPEIVDGWREVNLRFAVPPSFATAAGDVDWRWQAPNELARNQWQVLGAGSQTFPAHSIGPASYYAPVGNTVTLTWQSPLVSGTADDTLSDAVLIFSTDTPTVSGFTLLNASQELTGVTSNCVVPPQCVPTGIDYHLLTWDIPAGIGCDTFTDRTEVSGWGTSETDQAWTVSAPATQWNVAGGVGTAQPSTNNADRFSVITTNSIDNSVVASFSVSALPASGNLYVGVVPRYVDGDNHYIGRVQIATTGLVTAAITRRVATVGATVTSVATTLTIVPGERYKIRVQAVGSALAMKVWPEWQDEPSSWTLTATDANITTGTRVGVFVRNESAVTTQVFSFDDFTAVPFQLLDGRYELQRRDELDDDWQTILDTTNLCITEFADFEARVEVLSEYRIRLCNALDFCTDTWATTSGTLVGPGVAITGDGNSILIFTSNEDPSANLAYVMQFDDQPIESFAFPEADEVQLQRMFGKDFFTAFHPLERGGEQFARNILVNAAAIPVPSLANFRQLRDLGWAQLNYVCVRDELGNRWFANVRVPAGLTRMNRTIYMAPIEVTEVTATPTPIAEVPSV